MQLFKALLAKMAHGKQNDKVREIKIKGVRIITENDDNKSSSTKITCKEIE